MTTKTRYACDEKFTLYIRLRASGIKPTDAYKSGMPITQFSIRSTYRGTGPEYLQVADVIEWHERQLSGREKWRSDRDVCDAIKRDAEAWADGMHAALPGVKKMITYKPRGVYDV